MKFLPQKQMSAIWVPDLVRTIDSIKEFHLWHAFHHRLSLKNKCFGPRDLQSLRNEFKILLSLLKVEWAEKMSWKLIHDDAYRHNIIMKVSLMLKDWDDQHPTEFDSLTRAEFLDMLHSSDSTLTIEVLETLFNSQRKYVEDIDVPGVLTILIDRYQLEAYLDSNHPPTFSRVMAAYTTKRSWYSET
jgi:hypothetical protein